MIRVRFFPKETFFSLMIIEDNGEELSDELLTTLQKKLQDSAHSSAGVEMSGILNIQRRLHIFSNDRDTWKFRVLYLEGFALQLCSIWNQMIIPAPFAIIIHKSDDFCEM